MLKLLKVKVVKINFYYKTGNITYIDIDFNFSTIFLWDEFSNFSGSQDAKTFINKYIKYNKYIYKTLWTC